MKNLMALGRSAALCGMIVLLSGLVACEQGPLMDDMRSAQSAMLHGEYASAQRLLERYLRSTEDVDARWEAWKMLLEVTKKMNAESSWLVEYLETMVLEFEKNSKRLRVALQALAEHHETGRLYEKATLAWARYLDIPDLMPEERAEAYRHLAWLFIKQRLFVDAEEALQQCLALQLSPEDHAACLTDLAELAFLRDDIAMALTLSRQVYEQTDLSDTLRAKAGFILADMLEQQGQLKEALQVFTAILDVFPNEMVVEFRVENLQKALKK